MGVGKSEEVTSPLPRHLRASRGFARATSMPPARPKRSAADVAADTGPGGLVTDAASIFRS